VCVCVCACVCIGAFYVSCFARTCLFVILFSPHLRAPVSATKESIKENAAYRRSYERNRIESKYVTRQSRARFFSPPIARSVSEVRLIARSRHIAPLHDSWPIERSCVKSLARSLSSLYRVVASVRRVYSHPSCVRVYVYMDYTDHTSARVSRQCVLFRDVSRGADDKTRGRSLATLASSRGRRT
jgi:hypothetical protein